MAEFRFDPVSYLAGLGSGALVSVLAYRFRDRIGGLSFRATEQAASARRYATRSADARYTTDMRRFCQQYHLAGKRVNLTDILVEPRFIAGVRTFDTSGESKLHDVFRVVPLAHEFPASYAGINLPTLGIEDLGNGERHLALLGVPGSGRSTALAAIALWAMGQVEFEPGHDIIADVDEELTDKEREARQQERQEIQARALEQIAKAQKQASEDAGTAEEVRETIDLHRLMPILVHLDDLVITPELFGKKIDPAEPLVSAIQHNLRRVSSLTVPRYIYNRLNSGQALVLLDGLDDLPPGEQSYKLAWLRRFLEAYSHCFVIVAGSATGYYPLRQIGLTPIFMRPFSRQDSAALVSKWAAKWPAFAGEKRKLASPPTERSMDSALEHLNGLSAMDVFLKTMAAFSGGEDPGERWSWYNQFVTSHFKMKAFEGNDDLADDALFAVANLASLMIETGTLGATELRAFATNALRKEAAAEDDKKDAYLLDIDEFMNALTQQSGLMVIRQSGRIGFRHPLMAAFLASVTIIEPDAPYSVEQAADNPTWANAMPFAATYGPEEMFSRAINESLAQSPDLLYSKLFNAAKWVAGAPENAPWKGEVLKRLTAALIGPSQFPTLRARAMAALVATRDLSIAFILRQALRSTDAYVRQLACIGLGAVGDRESVKDLRPMMDDESLEVQIAATLSLGAIGSEKALEYMVDRGLLDGHESVRQATAEALAAIPGEGHQLLHAAITSEDMAVRRAAVFGLNRIQTPWALTDLYHALLEDDQWYVRSAAEQAFARAEGKLQAAATAHPALEDLAWAVDWALERGEEAPTPESAPDLMIRILNSDSQPYRVASARTLGYAGYAPAMAALYDCMRDKEEPVREEVYAALVDLQDQISTPLPGIH